MFVFIMFFEAVASTGRFVQGFDFEADASENFILYGQFDSGIRVWCEVFFRLIEQLLLPPQYPHL